MSHPVNTPLGRFGVVTSEELNANYIIPSVFHEDVHKAVAAAVRDAVRGS